MKQVMKTLIIGLVLCLTAGWTMAADAPRAFQQAVGENWPTLKETLGAHIDKEGNIKSAALGLIAADVAVEDGLLPKEATLEMKQRYAADFVLLHKLGLTINEKEFRERGQKENGYALPAFAQAISAPADTTPATTLPVPDEVTKQLTALGQRIDAVKVGEEASRKFAEESALAAKTAKEQTVTASGLTAKAVSAAEAAASAAKATTNDLAESRAAAKNSEQNAKASADSAAKAEKVAGAAANKTEWIVGAVTVLALLLVLVWYRGRRKTKAVSARVEKVAAELTEAVNAKVKEVTDPLLEKIDSKVKQTAEEVVKPLAERLENLEAAVPTKAFSFDAPGVREQQLAEIRATSIGEVYTLVFMAEGQMYELELYMRPGDKVAIPKGLRGHQAGNDLRIDGLFARLKKAVYEGRIDPVPLPVLKAA